MDNFQKPLRYLIGANEEDIVPDRHAVIVGPYDAPPIGSGPNIAYCNLFHERMKDEGQKYYPYLAGTRTSLDYGEGRIDPTGEGWRANLDRQYKLRREQGHTHIELDNADGYEHLFWAVLDELVCAHQFGLHVIAKNPLLLKREDAVAYVGHPNVKGVIVERDDDMAAKHTVSLMNSLRLATGQLSTPIWFVAFDEGRERKGYRWATQIAREISSQKLVGMGVTHSRAGEYVRAEDILRFKSP